MAKITLPPKRILIPIAVTLAAVGLIVAGYFLWPTLFSSQEITEPMKHNKRRCLPGAFFDLTCGMRMERKLML